MHVLAKELLNNYGDSSSSAKARASDHSNWGKTAVHKLLMVKSGLHERGRLCIPPSLKIHTFWEHYTFTEHSRTPLIRIDWDGMPSEYVENPDYRIFL
jgi:hypothetical protein